MSQSTQPPIPPAPPLPQASAPAAPTHSAPTRPDAPLARTPKRRRPLTVAAIAAGSVLVVALAFGGGMALGWNLGASQTPTQGQDFPEGGPGGSDEQFQGGPGGGNGSGDGTMPSRPDDESGQSDSDSDSDAS